jgi:hypothetical protein
VKRRQRPRLGVARINGSVLAETKRAVVVQVPLDWETGGRKRAAVVSIPYDVDVAEVVAELRALAAQLEEGAV